MPKRILQGVVVSNKMDKSIVVRVEKYVKDKLYKKFVKKSKKYIAHDENGVFKEGDAVKIQETKPISKNKSWIVLDKN